MCMYSHVCACMRVYARVCACMCVYACVCAFVVCYPARDADRREGDAGALDAEEVLGAGHADEGTGSGGAGAGGGAHHAPNVRHFFF